MLLRRKIKELITYYTFYSKAPLTEIIKGEIKRLYGACTINSLIINENRFLKKVYITGKVYYTLIIVYLTSI
jgi:hypothetical protein